jgi:hypothetical protein
MIELEPDGGEIVPGRQPAATIAADRDLLAALAVVL